MEGIKIPALRRSLQGQATLEGDKSVSFRAILLGPLAPGTRARNLAESPLVLQGLKAIETLGCSIKAEDDGWVKFRSYDRTIRYGEIDCGGSATLMRLAAGLLAGTEAEWRLYGNEQLATRPMERVAEPLRRMGAGIKTDDGYPPITIKGAKLHGIEYAPPIPSSQVKSTILIAGLSAEGETAVIEAAATRDHTERILKAMGVGVNAENTEKGRRISIQGTSQPEPAELFVPGDISSAALIIGAAVLKAGSEVTIKDVLLNPTRTAYIHHLEKMGADITVNITHPEHFEPYGDVVVKGGGRLRNVPILPAEAVNLIDEMPTLAMIGSFADGVFEIDEMGELRKKESDRIACTVHNLRAMGGDAQETEGGFSFSGGFEKHAAKFDSFGDHRMALACIMTGAILGGCRLSGYDAALLSFPTFERHIINLQKGSAD